MMMEAIAINHLYRTARGDDIGSPKAQSQPDIAAAVTQIYDQHSKQRSRPSLNDIFRALQPVCSNYAVIPFITLSSQQMLVSAVLVPTGYATSMAKVLFTSNL